MVCFGYITVNTLHKGDKGDDDENNDDDDDDDDNNNNNVKPGFCAILRQALCSTNSCSSTCICVFPFPAVVTRIS